MTLDERGLALVEILVAAGVIGLGIAGVMTVVPISSYGLREGHQTSTATFLAEQRLEQVRSAVWTETPDHDCLGLGAAAAPAVPAGKACTMGTPVLAAGAITFADEVDVDGYPGYRRTVRVRDCGTAPCAGITDADMRFVTVSVAYQPATGIGTSTGTKVATLALVVAKR